MFLGLVPHYPAARQNQLVTIPAPVFRYNGEVLKADDDGIRGQLWESETLVFSLSFSGSFPVSSEENADRIGMPTLDLLVEFGPKLVWTPYKSDNKKLSVQIPLRAIGSFRFDHAEEQGFAFAPFVRWRNKNVFLDGDAFNLIFETKLATKKLHQYFYEVSPSFATAERPAYVANSGYVGSSVTAGYVIYKKTRSYFFFVSADNYSGSANEKSPLFFEHNSLTAGIGLSWTLWTVKFEAEQPTNLMPLSN